MVCNNHSKPFWLGIRLGDETGEAFLVHFYLGSGQAVGELFERVNFFAAFGALNFK